ncbi:hypothetical protein [Sandarakinorhabdus sp.]|uniref:hypothetical protein n=1 Tax=Sandarakinorhabdus sp. TaxID=1916663 RepID=UPI003342C1E0
MSGFVGGGVGRAGMGARRIAVVGSADFSLSAASLITLWDTAAVGELVPIGAPPGSYFVLAFEPAGLAVVNG